MSEPTQACIVPDCERPVAARALCWGHYLHARRHGDPQNCGICLLHQEYMSLARQVKQCTVEGCEGRRFGRGMCQTHYRRWRRSLGLDVAHKPPREPRFCSEPECGNRVFGRGLCQTHYRRWRRSQGRDRSSRGSDIGSG